MAAWLLAYYQQLLSIGREAQSSRAPAEEQSVYTVVLASAGEQKIAVRREIFPMCANGGVEMRDMLVDFAPYLFRGALAGFLTRLSATGLANVTSGGGQVPAFVVTGKMD